MKTTKAFIISAWLLLVLFCNFANAESYSHSKELTGLQPNTTYHYRIRTQNADGDEYVSGDYTFTTNAAATAGPGLTGFSATNITTSSAKLNWACDQQCTGYYEIGTTTSYGTTNSPGQADLTYSAHSQSVSGLAANTLYHWRAISKNAANAITISPDQTFTTLESGGSTGGTYHAPPPTSTLVVNVKDKGATGNGSTNDTAAIQAAVNQVGGTGGTVLVPVGTYMIDVTVAINLKSNMTFRMDNGAVLKAIPTNAGSYAILKASQVTNVNIVGGKVQGERHQHLTPGDYTTCGDSCYGEWGMGVWIAASTNIYVDGVTSTENWGDGFYQAGWPSASANINLYNVIADDNRRQGVSIEHVDGMEIRDSIFKNTGGAWPMSGLDFEPFDVSHFVRNVKLINNQFNNNFTGITHGSRGGTNTNIIIDGNSELNNTYACIRKTSRATNEVITNNICSGSQYTILSGS